jgi:hypothetical protein
MASLNPESDISAFVSTVFEAAILVARDNNFMPSTVRTFADRTGLAVRQNSQYGGATMNQIGETDDLVGQAFTPSSIATLTPVEFGAQYFITDSRVESDPFSVRNDAATDLGQALATKVETSLMGHFNELTSGTIGASGSTCTWSYVMAMESVLKAAMAPYPYVLVLSPAQWYPLAKAASVASSAATNAADSLKEAVQSTFFVKQFGGVSIFVSGNVETSSTDAYAGMFSRDALAYDVRRAPRMEPDRDPSRRGIELNLTSVFAHGVWRPKFGVCGLFANSAPTGV